MITQHKELAGDTLTYDQVLHLVQQRSLREKIALARELEDETFEHRFAKLLTALKIHELTEKDITHEVEAVRMKRYRHPQAS